MSNCKFSAHMFVSTHVSRVKANPELLLTIDVIAYLMLLDKSNKLGGELIKLILSLGLHGLQIASSSDDYHDNQEKSALLANVSCCF